MIAIQRILCPVDFTDYSRRALDHARVIARWYGASVTALHVLEVPDIGVAPGVPGLQPPAPSPADRERVLAALRQFAGTEPASGAPGEVLLREGHPVREILAQAAAMHADLLVLGTHGRSGFERLLLGSVAEKVLRRADCPVLTVPRRLSDAAPGTPVVVKRILCPVDFSAASLRALEYAMSMAEEADAHLTVLHVIAHELGSEADMPDALIIEGRLTLAEFRQQREESIRRRLKAIVPDSIAEFCSAESRVAYGKPAREILRLAAEQEAELVVMGVEGRGAADLAVFGSTTQQVVRGAVCPVLTLRQK